MSKYNTIFNFLFNNTALVLLPVDTYNLMQFRVLIMRIV
jgi:hypothetical protein